MKNIIKNNLNIILAELLILLAFIVFYGRFGDVIVDSFREAYIPSQMLAGKIIYKNIFCIYAPISYMINAFLMFLFGINLKVIYAAGLIATMTLFYIFNKIAEKFLDKFTIFGILFLTFSALVLSPNVFNTFFPYSFGLLYGITFASASVLAALNKKYILSSLLAGIAAGCKYEFILLIPVVLFMARSENIYKTMAAALIAPVSTFIYLISCGVGLNDFKAIYDVIILMSGSATLKWFYSLNGLFFRIDILKLYLVSIIKFLLPVVAVILCTRLFKFNNLIKFLSVILLLAVTVGLKFYCPVYQTIFVYFLPLIMILFFVNFKNLKINERFFIIAAIIISLKVFFALNLQSYGVYFLFFALVSVSIFLPVHLRKYFALLLITWAVVIGLNQCEILLSKNVTISTANGVVRPSEKYNGIEDLTDYIESLPSNAKVVVYPEGLFANFLTGRPSDNKFYSLIPLYTETFGEDLIIERLKIYPPDYIVLSNYDTYAYYFRQFGGDYALKIDKFIKNNYAFESEFGKFITFKVYKKIADVTN